MSSNVNERNAMRRAGEREGAAQANGERENSVNGVRGENGTQR